MREDAGCRFRCPVVQARRLLAAIPLMACLLITGCGPHFHELRVEGQKAMIDGNYAAARSNFQDAYRLWPANPQNLFDLGTVCMIYAERRRAEGDEVAAQRELDRAIEYFSRAIESHPGMQAALDAKNEALEMKGRFDEALKHTEWAATFVGPSAKRQLVLARELEERGDLDAALLRYHQAVAFEPDNAAAHAALGRFLHRTGHTDKAIQSLNRAYELNPLEPGVAELLTSLGQPLPRTIKPPSE